MRIFNDDRDCVVVCGTGGGGCGDDDDLGCGDGCGDWFR